MSIKPHLVAAYKHNSSVRRVPDTRRRSFSTQRSRGRRRRARPSRHRRTEFRVQRALIRANNAVDVCRDNGTGDTAVPSKVKRIRFRADTTCRGSRSLRTGLSSVVGLNGNAGAANDITTPNTYIYIYISSLGIAFPSILERRRGFLPSPFR